MAPPRTNFKESPNSLAFAELCFHLNDGEYSRLQLMELTGIVDSTLRKWMRYLRRPGKRLVYICERRRSLNVGQPLLIYTWGPGEADAPKIVRETQAVYSARYRVKKLQRTALYGISE